MPMAMAPTSGWNNSPAAGEAEQFGIPARPMGLKVLYTFDKEAKVNCLARGSQALRVQTIPIDETNTIGVVDLRACIHTVTECSPELTTQECDYTIYAVDYSEPDTPLVGQGLLSWILESMRADAGNLQPKMVTGRVTKNLLGFFSGGNRETLEVRLKLSETTRLPRPIEHGPMDLQPSRPMEMAITPTGASEWNSFIQSNPQIGQPAGLVHASRVASPALSQGPSAPTNMRDSLGPSFNQNMPTQEVQRVAPTPVDPQPVPAAPAPSSRPSSRASNRPPRRKPPTGRPRGRPRKKPAEGHTSGYEDGTEGEEGPAKKRAKTTKVEKNYPNPFVAGPESLRVAASNSSSLRNFRPIAVNSDNATSSHLQEVPRAPTPAPDGVLRGLPGRAPNAIKLRHESTLRHPLVPDYSSSFSEPRRALSPSQDGRSPDSIAPTPNYSDGSPADIGSSPPVQRATPYIRSSPPPSSPVLPPMPPVPLPRESSFANNELDELFGEEPPQAAPEQELPPPPPVRKAVKQSPGVPIQVFQIQNGPAGQDLVHICSYTTPHPSSSAPAPPEALSLPPLKQDPARPQPSGTTAKRKRPRAPSSPVLAPTPPPTTDAVEKALSPVHIPPTPVPAPTPASVSTFTPAPAPTPASTAAHASTPIHASTPVHTPVHASTPAPEPPQAAAASDDASDDPIVQLASHFSMREAPQPVQPSLQQSLHSLHPPKPHLTKPKRPRQLNRSQSAGPLALPSVPASDPIGPSSLSQFVVGEPERPCTTAVPPALRRSASIGPLIMPVPLSAPAEPAPIEPAIASLDSMGSEEACPAPERSHIAAIPPALRRSASIGPLALSMPENAPAEPAPTEPVPASLNPTGLEETCPPSDSVPPPSSPTASRSNKNIVKKHAIKQRLEEAIINGVMPPFCSNCGAIETPTWRKIWVQEREGVPEKCEYSEKPGRVTTMEILRRDAENKPTLHRVIKKSLAPADDKTAWQGMLLCNPCGIWLAKCKCHRPSDRWDKDASRLGQERRKRGTGRSTSRPKKSRTKDGSQINLTSEAYLPTDALEPPAPSSPRLAGALSSQLDLTRPGSRDGQELETRALSKMEDSDNNDMRSLPGSTHSRGSGTAQSPIEVEFEEAVGSTKRLLFPSPRKDGVPKVLCDLDVNLVQTGDCGQPKEMTGEKENATVEAQDGAAHKHDDFEALIRSLANERPSTPPPNVRSAPVEPFKTPTRPTPNHRPITRSVSRSLRSVRSVVSPSQQAHQQTPTKTPRSALRIPGSSTRRRSPRNHQANLDVFDSPISRSIVQLLSEQNGFGLGGHELDLSSLPTLDRQDCGLIDFGNLLSTDGAVPSSPPKDGSIGFEYDGSANDWASWNMEHAMDTGK